MSSSPVEVSVQPPFLRSAPGPHPPWPQCPSAPVRGPSSDMRLSAKTSNSRGHAPATGNSDLPSLHGAGKRVSREKTQNPAWAGLKGRGARTGQCQAPRGWHGRGEEATAVLPVSNVNGQDGSSNLDKVQGNSLSILAYSGDSSECPRRRFRDRNVSSVSEAVSLVGPCGRPCSAEPVS